jgi:hypothetical protein
MIESPKGDSAIAEEYRANLAEALSDAALDEFAERDTPSEAARLAAYELASALGMCQLLHIKPGPELDGILPPKMALAAADVLRTCVQRWTQNAKSLPDEWGECDDQSEADDLCLNLLDSRMECLACEAALSEAYLDAYDLNDALAESLSSAIKRIDAARIEFDEQLQKVADLLSTLALTNYFSNGRALFKHFVLEELLPWWLDGRIEEHGRHVDRMIDWSLSADAPGAPPSPQLLTLPETWSTALWPAAAAMACEPASRLSSAEKAKTTIYEWVSPPPNSKWRAILVVPATPELGDAATLRLVFRDRDDRALKELAGRIVTLATCRATINTDAFAEFLYEDLRKAGAELRLMLDPPGEEWHLDSVSPDHAGRSPES